LRSAQRRRQIARVPCGQRPFSPVLIHLTRHPFYVTNGHSIMRIRSA
jgi:hypothetical protein